MTTLTPYQLDRLAEKVAAKLSEKILAAQDEMLPLSRVAEEKGLSMSFLYHNWEQLGGMKSGGKIFISRRGLELYLRGEVPAAILKRMTPSERTRGHRGGRNPED